MSDAEKYPVLTGRMKSKQRTDEKPKPVTVVTTVIDFLVVAGQWWDEQAAFHGAEMFREAARLFQDQQARIDELERALPAAGTVQFSLDDVEDMRATVALLLEQDGEHAEDCYQKRCSCTVTLARSLQQVLGDPEGSAT